MTQWHHEVDFLVVGSGAGGMTAALTAKHYGLDSLVIEKSAYYGGTSAMSGGVLWIPNNHLMPRAGIRDSREDALRYLCQVVSSDVAAEKLEAFVDQGPQMLKFLEANSLVCFDPAPQYPDYYAELEGGKAGARSLDPRPYSMRAFGEALTRKMRVTNLVDTMSFSMTADEAHQVFSFTWRSPLVIFKRIFLYWLDIPSRLKKLPDNRLTLGRALVSRLRHSLDMQSVPLWLNADLRKVYVDDGTVLGVQCMHEGELKDIRCRKGVVVASGGFAHNDAMRKLYQKAPIGAKWTASSPTDTGEGIELANEAGAQLDMLSYAWWSPTMVLPGDRVEALIVGKSMPSCMVVNKAGLRFCNEAEPYEDFVKSQYASQETVDSIPAFFVFDSRYRHEYPLGTAMAPGKFLADGAYKELFASGWIKKADSLAELAEAWAIDVAGLQATADKLAAYSKVGVDADFGKGATLNDRYYSDHRIKPNPCLAGLLKPPFYAIEIWPGDLGTKGGIKTNEFAQALDSQDNPIKGLYAAGNASASVMGNSYPGAGSTLGPAMTFGYVAAMHAAGKIGA